VKLQENPKHGLFDDFGDDARRALGRGRPFSLYLERSRGQQVVAVCPTMGCGKLLAVIVPAEKIFGVARESFFFSPTTLHWMRQVFAAHPDLFAGYDLKEYEGAYGERFEWAETGYTVERFMAELKLVHEESVVRFGREQKGQRKDFDYWAMHGPREVLWYHATSKANLPSILETGLVPSSLAEKRTEGWSPGWNMHLQKAVYLTSDEGYARRIAETIAERTEGDAVVLSVDGAGLEDTKRVTFDEDALYDEYGGPHYDGFDRDFPQWVTSEEHRVHSIAYIGRIAPSHISVLATGVYTVEALARGYTEGSPETHPNDYEFVPEVTWDDAPEVAPIEIEEPS
jgi:hypothetical protein